MEQKLLFIGVLSFCRGGFHIRPKTSYRFTRSNAFVSGRIWNPSLRVFVNPFIDNNFSGNHTKGKNYSSPSSPFFLSLFTLISGSSPFCLITILMGVPLKPYTSRRQFSI